MRIRSVTADERYPAIPLDRRSRRLEDLYAELLPVVFGFCRSRLPVHDAEDVTAEVFRAAAEKLHSDPNAALSRSWFITSAQHLIIDRWRRDVRWEGRLTTLAATHRAEQKAAFDPDRTDDVVEALDRLPAMQRAALILHYVEGRPVREIAELFQRKPGAVDSLLARARRGLIQEIGRATS